MLLIYRNITKHHIHAFTIYLLNMLHAFSIYRPNAFMVKNLLLTTVIQLSFEDFQKLLGGGALPLFVYLKYNTPPLMLCMYTIYCATEQSLNLTLAREK
jgi:hypothetical protein